MSSLSENMLRIVLVGYNGSGKSSAGNTILGKPAFESKRSVLSSVREGYVAGKHITVVDTPGRRRTSCSKFTPRLYKDEIVLSSSLCPPGPHVFLLVIRVNICFDDVYRKAVEEHTALLGHKIWDHIIVLFTFGDCLRDMSIEEFIEREGEALRWIIEKCGNRYHVFNNTITDDRSQVTELLDKIKKMLVGHRGRCFDINNPNLKDMKKRRIKVEERANQMIVEQKKRKQSINSISGHIQRPTKIVLFGGHCSDLGSAGNRILGRKTFPTEGLEDNVEDDGEIDEKKLTVVCTLPFEKDFQAGEGLENAKASIFRGCSGAHALVLVLCIDCSFADEEKSALEKIMEPLGKSVWNHTLVLFSVEEEMVETPIEMFIASEGDALQWLIEKCGKRYHVLNNKNWGDRSQVGELLEKIDKMVVENQGCTFEMSKKMLLPVKEKRAKQRRMKFERKEREIDEKNQEEIIRSDPISVNRTRSIDIPLNFAGSTKSSGYWTMSVSTQETPVKRIFKESETTSEFFGTLDSNENSNQQ